MRIEKKIVNIIFDAGRGSVAVSSREGVCGEAFGALPTPSRNGYDFDGWYLGEEKITPQSVLDSETDVRLQAHWIKRAGEKKKRSVMRSQVITCIALAVCILFLSVSIVVANRLVAIYPLIDEYYDTNGEKQTERYTIKRENGVYKLFNRQGKLMETTENGYTLTNTDKTQVRYEVYVAETSGNQYVINTATGEYETYAVVDYDENEGELLGGTVKAKRVMMFPRVGQDNTYSIEVKNQYGTYKLYRKNVETTSTGAKKYTNSIVVSKDGQDTLAVYDATLFASLCVSCGYTLTLQKLDFTAAGAPLKADGSIDYAEYGLENRYDATTGELIYTPTTYTITKAAYASNGSCSPATEWFDFDGDAANGKETERTVQYTVTVGDALVSGGGYYVKLSSNYANPNYEGREAVYIVSNTISSTVLQPVEALVTPSLVYPMSISTYVMVYNFRLGTVGRYIDVPEDELESQLKLVSAFDYIDLTKRENTMYSSQPYLLSEGVDLMKGYRFNGDNVSTVLGNIYQMEYVGCRVLQPDDEDLKNYRLDENVFFLSFDYDPFIASGGSEEDEWVSNMLIISQRTEQGTYYVYSTMYDMIVEVDQYYLSFLEWKASDWYESNFFQNNISYVKNLNIYAGDKSYEFTLDNKFSYAFYDNGDGTGTLINSSDGTFTQNADGSYTFTVTKTGAQHKVQFVDFTAGRTQREYYKTSNNTTASRIVYISENNVKVEITENTNNLQVICPQYQDGKGGVVDYTIEDSYITDKGLPKTDTYTALDNFKRLYAKLLWYSIEGDITEKELGSDVKTYIENNECTATIRYDIEDMASIMNPENYTENNKQSVVIRFYRYNGLRALLTVEVLDHAGATPDATKAQGAFYVNARELDAILGYAQDYLDGNLLPSSF